MNFDNISGIVPVSDLNTIVLGNVKSGLDYSVSVVVDGSEIFSDTFRSHKAQLKIFGVGDMIFDSAAGVLAPECTVTVTPPGGGGQTKRFTALITRLSIPDMSAGFSGDFLHMSNLSLCPAGTEVCLAALGPDISVTEQPDLTVEPYSGDAYTVSASRSGMGAVYRFTLPDNPGVVSARLGRRYHCFVVADMPGAHCILYRNPFNAPEYVWLLAKVTARNERSAQYATVSGEGREYDVNVVSEFEFSAKAVLPATRDYLVWLPYSTEIMIDGIPVTVSELKTETSKESSELFELKFTARLKNRRDVIFGGGVSGIFRSPFDRSFN